MLFNVATANLAAARRPWAVARGPGAAVVLTLRRLNWVGSSPFLWVTDAGRCLDLQVDPPVVVVREVHAAVQRWRWANILKSYPASPQSLVGCCFAPVRRLLVSREESARWNTELRVALVSAVTNRQWCQARLLGAHMAEHGACIFCLAQTRSGASLCLDSAYPRVGTATSSSDGHAGGGAARSHAPALYALSAEEGTAVPLGTLTHRVWECPALRMHMARAVEVRASEDLRFGRLGPLAACARAFFPGAPVEVPLPSLDDTFTWVMRPIDDMVQGKVYTDGSRLDGPSSVLARNGWAFVVLDEHDCIVAEAHGLPPRWVDDIPGTEAWAVLQAAIRAVPGCEYRVDCMPCVDALHRGVKWATAPHRPLARVHAMLGHAVDDVPASAFVWMPAHTSNHDVGVLQLGDGSYLTEADRSANNRADVLAKQAVERHRVPDGIRRQCAERDEDVRGLSRWVAMATYLANHRGEAPFGDSEASPAARALRHAAVARRRASGEAPVRTLRVSRPPALPLHALVQASTGQWSCTVCLRSAARRQRLEAFCCRGSAAEAWAATAAARCAGAAAPSTEHDRAVTGTVFWCRVCGGFAETLAVRLLARACPGPPQAGRHDGRSRQLKRLRAGCHPRAGQPLGARAPPPAPEAAAPQAPTPRVAALLARVLARQAAAVVAPGAGAAEGVEAAEEVGG